MTKWVSWGVAWLVAFGASRTASAWEIADPEHHNCHEQMTAAALAQVGYLPSSPPVTTLTQDQAAFLDDGDYTYSYDRNLQAAALITGVRSNDLEGASDSDSNALAAVLVDPLQQDAQCLRMPTDLGSAGDIAALQRCTQFISAEVNRALSAQDSTGNIDPTILEPVSVYLPFEGTVAYPLSTFWYHAGRALHAVQDSFAHGFRDPTWASPTSIHNLVDQVRGDLVESRNGHGHERALDDCTSLRPSRPAQVQAAQQASVDLLTILTATEDPVTRQTQIAGFLAQWFTFTSGCDLDNDYCQNAVYAELKERWSLDYPTAESTGCRATTGSALGWPALLVLVWLFGRRTKWTAALLIALMALLAPASVRAEDESSPNDPPGLRYIAHIGLSADNPAFAYGGGAIWQFERWEVGIQAEHNPWVNLDAPAVTLGSLNVYAMVGWRHVLSANFSYRAGLDLGAATLLVNTVGSSPGQVGVLAALEPLSVIYHPPGAVAFEVSGFTLVVPEVQFRGWPFGYPQYRLSFSVRFH